MSRETIQLHIGDRVYLAAAPHDVGVIERIYLHGGHCQLCDDLSGLAGEYVPHTGPYAWCRFEVYGEGSYGLHELEPVPVDAGGAA